MGRKRKNLSEMSVANGKVWDGNELNLFNLKKYDCSTAAEYEVKIRNMNKFDLDQHATSVCVLPRENKEGLIEQLLKEFKTNKF